MGDSVDSVEEKKETRNTRRSFTAALKKKIIAYAEKNGNRSAQREFNVCESSIRKWRKNKAIIQIMPRGKRALTSGKVRWPQLEKRLAEEFRNGNGMAHVRTQDIQERAIKLAREEFHLDDFSGNISWVTRFIRRNGLKSGGLRGKKDSNENEVQIRKLMEQAKRTDFDHMYYRITPDSVLLAN